jgi:hypothetical protein
MSDAPQITARDIRELLDSPAEQPVLHIKLDEDDGAPGALGVWADALVPQHTVVLTREAAEDLLGSDPDAAAIAEYLPQLQDDVDDVFASLDDHRA